MNNNNGIQIWTVPATGLYNITIAGVLDAQAVLVKDMVLL